MTIESKLMSAEELVKQGSYQPQICHDGECWNDKCPCRLRAHIVAQEQRIADLELRLSIATELNVADRREIDRLRTALTDAASYWRYPCLSAREKERKDEIVAMLDE